MRKKNPNNKLHKNVCDQIFCSTLIKLQPFNAISDSFNNLKDGKNNGKHINPFGNNGPGKKHAMLKFKNKLGVIKYTPKYDNNTYFSASIEKVPKHWKSGVKTNNIFGNNNPG